MADQFVLDGFVHATSNACITDLTPPTFAGITSLVANLNGSLTASWSAATEPSTPVRYEIYIQANTATGMFVDSNVSNITYSTTHTIFLDADDVALEQDVTYYVGVRAIDAVGNEETNTISMSAVSLGVLTENLGTIVNELTAAVAELSSERSQGKGVFSISSANEFSGKIWFEFKGQVVTSLLGAASYTVYDASDVAVAGLTESGLTANGNGTYIITPVSAASLEPFVSYRVKITVVYNSVPYTSYKGFTVGE